MENDLFWQRLDRLLAEAGDAAGKEISMSEISVFSFMHRNAYKNAHDEKSTPSINFVDGIARFLDVSVEYIVNGLGRERPYIPDEIPPPTNPEQVLKRAREYAARQGVRAATIALVLSQKPDPRLGSERIAELFFRAHAQTPEQKALRKAERASKKKKRPPKPRRATPASRQ